MSYMQQLRSVFTDPELDTLKKLVEEESIASAVMLSSVDKRAIKSIRDKLRGEQHISSPKTTAPSKL